MFTSRPMGLLIKMTKNKSQGLKKCKLLFPERYCSTGGVLLEQMQCPKRDFEKEVTATLWEIVTEEKGKGCCDFALPAYISTHLRMPFALGRTGAHTEHRSLHNGTVCPLSHLVLLTRSLSLSPLSSCYILLLPLLLTLCYR